MLIQSQEQQEPHPLVFLCVEPLEPFPEVELVCLQADRESKTVLKAQDGQIRRWWVAAARLMSAAGVAKATV